MSTAEEDSSSDETDSPLVLSGSGSQPVSQPNSVLDRAELLSQLFGTGIEVHHLNCFYRELHLQAYPELRDFVNTYQSTKLGKRAEEDTLPESLLAFLLDANNQCVTMASKIQEITASPSGKSVKLDVGLYDGNSVETIITRVSDRGKHVASISISSQVGCSLECPYGPANAFVRDLSATEMIEQVIHASRELQKDETPHTIRKVVFMGNGEPLLNYDAVVVSCRFLVEIFKLGRGSITISTVGITPRIFDLTRDLPNVIVCLRLYAPTQELRGSILPVSSRYGLGGILEALDNHMATSKHQMAYENHQMLSRKRRVMIEYLMVKGKTTTVDCAHELGELCALRDLIVTLVPFVRWSKEDSRRCPSVRAISEFKAIVSSYGVQCSVRLSAGSDIRHSLVMQTETQHDSSQEPRKPESDIGEEKSDFWKKLDLVKKESSKKRRRARKLAEEDGVKSDSSVLSDPFPLALEQAVFSSPSNRPDASDESVLGIESIDLDDYNDDAPEVFLSSSQERSMVLSDGTFSDDSFDDACDIDPTLGSSPSKSSPRPLDRSIPSPNSLLDRVSFLEALDDADIDASLTEIDVFYKALHQLDYPPIGEFVQRYEDSRNSSDVAKADAKQSVSLEISNFALDPLNGFVSMSTKIQSCRNSSDFNSFRLYIQLYDGYIVETVAMRIALEGKQCSSISVSTQVSSPTGLSGNFNLQTSEIIEQIIHATRTLEAHKENEYDTPESIGKISFLGCGEPLLNYDNVVDACFFVGEKPMWNVNKERMTISTIGITPRIFDLTRDLPDVNIALDLRAPTQDLRSSVVLLAQRYSLDGLMEALDNHTGRHADPDEMTGSGDVARREKVIIRYKMVQDETSKLECAHELGLLCKRHNLGVNLVPYIRRSNEDTGKCPSMRHINEFKEAVTSYGVACTVKLPLGATVKDPKKQFVVAAERRSSSESVVRMKYRDDKRSEIDFWETLAVVKKESKRKRRKSQQLMSEKVRALNLYDDKAMVANFSASVVSFVAIRGSMGVSTFSGTDADADDNIPVIEFEHGSFPMKSVSAETSVETRSVGNASTASETENALSGWSAIGATECFNQDCTESAEGSCASTHGYCVQADEATLAESQNDVEEATNTGLAPTSPVTGFIHDTESSSGGGGVAAAAVAGGSVGALSGAVLATKNPGEDGASVRKVEDNELQVISEEVSSDHTSLAVSDNVLYAETETEDGVVALAAVAGGTVGALSVAVMTTTSVGEDGDRAPELSSTELRESIEDVSSDSSDSPSLATVENDLDTETETSDLNGGVVAAAVAVAGGAAGIFSVAALATNDGEDDGGVPELRRNKFQESVGEVSSSSAVADNVSDTGTESRGLDDGAVALAAVAGGTVGALSVAAMATNTAGEDDDRVPESRSNGLQESIDEDSSDTPSLTATDYVPDTEIETRGLDDGDDKAPSVDRQIAQLDSQLAAVDTNPTSANSVLSGAVSTVEAAAAPRAVEGTPNGDEEKGDTSNSHDDKNIDERTQTLDPIDEAPGVAAFRADRTLAPISAVLKSEIGDGDDFDYELSPELLDEILQSSGDDFSFSSTPGDHSATMNMLAMQQNMIAQLENSEIDDEGHDDPFSALYTIDEQETEDDDSEYFDDDDSEYNDSGDGTQDIFDDAADVDSNALSVSERSSKGQTEKLNYAATMTTSLSQDDVTVEERLDESEKARAELDATNKFLLSQMEHIALQANGELTAQIEQSEEFRQQMLEAQTLQKRAEEEKTQIENKLNELQFNDESGLLKERNELRERLSVLQFEHNELQAENMRLEKNYARASSRSTLSKESEFTVGAPATRLADALEDIKRIHEENIRLTSDADERSYQKEEELTEILTERNEMQKALREAVKSLILREEQLAAALEETRRVEQDYARLVRDNDDHSLGREQELLDMWKKNDDLQNTLAEAIACTNQKEEELARLTAASEEIAHRRKLENIEFEKTLKESASALSKKEEEFSSLAALVENNADNKDAETESLRLQNQALEQHLAAAYRFSESAPNSESTAQLTEEVAHLKGRIIELELANTFFQANNKQVEASLKSSRAQCETLSTKDCRNVEMQKMSEQHAELRAMCDRLEHEKAEMAAAAEKERAKASEKLKLISDMATAHLTGRLGLEARLQASEKARHQLDLDNQFMTGKMEVIDFQSVTEIQSLRAQAQHLRLLLTKARNEQTVAEEENVILELQQAMSDNDDGSESTSHFDSEYDPDFDGSSRASSVSCITGHGY